MLAAWGFEYKTNLIWYKTRKEYAPDWATYANHSQAKRDTPQQLSLIEREA